VTDTPAFSIIVPVYNNGRELARCLRSLREKNSDHQVEIIVVDDCSPDEGALIEIASKQYQRIANAFQRIVVPA
jgi:glycosyltransferase involved in cell wall biosynthesis